MRELAKWNQKIIPVVIKKALKELSKGHGLKSTKWKGDRVIINIYIYCQGRVVKDKEEILEGLKVGDWVHQRRAIKRKIIDHKEKEINSQFIGDKWGIKIYLFMMFYTWQVYVFIKLKF